ncbi:MAG: sterol desaturase family protein [Nannocystaceae bacterium]
MLPSAPDFALELELEWGRDVSSDRMEGTPNYAVFALPVFAAAIVAETLLARRRGRLSELYSMGTAVSDIGCGAVFQAVEVLLNLATLGAYAWLYEHARVLTWEPSSPWPWVLGLLGVDFLYYWWHRVSHVANVMWAVHGVHHQSEDYNLAVALRQPVLEPITWFLFYWVLALLGVPPLIYVVGIGANLFYQFWIHTELVDRLPRPLEWVLNTPSHHRVHHGVDAEYLDRNYGGVLVVWDRLFGSFEPERRRPTYGTTVPLRSYNPVWGNVQHLHRTWRLSRAARAWSDKLWVWVAHPAWLPRGVTDPNKGARRDAGRPPKYRPPLPRAKAWYVGASMALLVGLAGPFVFVGHMLELPQIAAAAAVLVLGHTALSGVMEARPWAPALDGVRIVGLAVVTGWLCATEWGTDVGLMVAGAIAAVSLASRLVLLPTRPAVSPSAE